VSSQTREEVEAEVAAIFARLKDEIRSGSSGGGDATARAPSRTLAARSQAERAWAVTAERPFEHPPTRGGRMRSLVVVPTKRLLRKLMRWYVEPAAAHQRSFNLAVLRLIDELAERMDAVERRIDALEGRVSGWEVERGG
jgi:hypothetical protein